MVTVVGSTCKVMMRGPLKFLNRDEDDVLGMAEVKIQKLMLELCFMLGIHLFSTHR